jgi:hypothetical protein
MQRNQSEFIQQRERVHLPVLMCRPLLMPILKEMPRWNDYVLPARSTDTAYRITRHELSDHTRHTLRTLPAGAYRLDATRSNVHMSYTSLCGSRPLRTVHSLHA